MPCRSVACCDTRLPLSPHCNPSSVLKKDSLGVFHYRLSAPYPLLQIWFRGTVLITFGRKAMLTPTPIPTQGRLLCTQHLRPKAESHRIAGSNLLRAAIAYHKGVRCPTIAGLHRSRVGFSMPLESAPDLQA